MLSAARRTLLVILCLVAVPMLSAAGTKTKKKAADAGAADAAAPAQADDRVGAQFEEFCTSWMAKLAAREARNVTLIEWHESASGVEGEYVGYSTEHTCEMKPTPAGGVPVGRINYRELKYRKRGGSKDTASGSPPEIVEITEVTEIFRYDKGKWIY